MVKLAPNDTPLSPFDYDEHGVRIPQGSPPRTEYPGSYPITRTSWRAWQADEERRFARYRIVHPDWTPRPPSVPEPSPNLWERLHDWLGAYL